MQESINIIGTNIIQKRSRKKSKQLNEVTQKSQHITKTRLFKYIENFTSKNL